GSSLPVDQWLQMKLTARGSNVELHCQGVKVVETTKSLKRGQLAVLLQGHTESSVRNVRIFGEAPTCFVVMQFTEEFDVLYRDVIYPVCESYGYKVIRGDDFYTSGQIMEDVTRSIRSAALIIADVTPNNANVFYEVGFAHAIGKPTILLSDRKRERLPFDIAGFRALFYDNTIGGKGVVEMRLKQHLDALRPK
ncbi:MAG TPA: nucleoside 2-deoxyribosyltransferase, partial [Rhodocyclaceae bacterium]|nr:nucleoside 2-deoxyribosyltransferase [Rhodocyclaceae bacterium]